MASDVFTIMAQKTYPLFSFPKLLSFQISPITKGQEKKSSPEAAIFASIKKETRSNEIIEAEPPCSVQQQNVI